MPISWSGSKTSLRSGGDQRLERVIALQRHDGDLLDLARLVGEVDRLEVGEDFPHRLEDARRRRAVGEHDPLPVALGVPADLLEPVEVDADDEGDLAGVAGPHEVVAPGPRVLGAVGEDLFGGHDSALRPDRLLDDQRHLEPELHQMAEDRLGGLGRLAPRGFRVEREDGAPRRVRESIGLPWYATMELAKTVCATRRGSGWAKAKSPRSSTRGSTISLTTGDPAALVVKLGTRWNSLTLWPL